MKPRTLATALNTNAFDAYLNLDKNGVIDLVYFITEDKCNHPKHLSNLSYLSLEYSPETLALFQRYTDEVNFNEVIYDKFYAHMYTLMCNISRHNNNFQYVPDHDFLHSINMIYRFYYGLLTKEKIDLVIFGYTPHVGHDNILYWLCELLGVRTIILQPCCTIGSNTPFMQYATKLEDAISFQHLDLRFRETHETINETFKFIHPCTKWFKPYHRSMPLVKYLNPVKGLRDGWRFLMGHDAEDRNVFERALHSIALQSRAYFLYRDYKRCQARYMKPYDGSKKFVYFALHYQPELTTSMRGIYADQLLALERLSALVPSDWMIYVKENPTQKEYMRGDLFFKRMSLIPNVRYLDALIPSSTLLRECQFVASINGSVTYESICGGKPALIFGEAWWQFLPGVVRYRHGLTVADILSTAIDKKLLVQKLNDYLARTPKCTTDNEVSLREFNPGFSHEENLKTLEYFLIRLVTKALSEE